MVAIHADPLVGGGSVSRVTLPSGHFFIVDTADLPRVEQHSWCVRRSKNTTYVQTGNGRFREALALNRFLLDAPTGFDVDHVNRDRLDNRRANLRLATRSQNVANTGLRSNNTSGFKGVVWDKVRGKWYASIGVDGRRRVLGRFDDPWEAAEAYNAAALEAWGEFAWLNEKAAA